METPLRKEPGASGEVLRLAIPLILSSSVLTLQVFIGRVLLPEGMGRSFDSLN